MRSRFYIVVSCHRSRAVEANIQKRMNRMRSKQFGGSDGTEVVAGLIFSTSEEVDLVITTSGAAQNHPMGVEGCGRDGRATVLLQET